MLKKLQKISTTKKFVITTVIIFVCIAIYYIFFELAELKGEEEHFFDTSTTPSSTMMKTVNYICSLGTLCNTASCIKQMQMKKCSFPFDWIFSNPNMIIDCIDNDFKIFLDRNFHIPHEILPNSKKGSGHKVYGGKMFNHHYILEDNTYRYFVRCVNRFRILTKKKENKLFIISFVNKREKISKELKNNIINLYKKLESITTNFNLLVVYHRIDHNMRSEIVELNENFKIIEIFTRAESDGNRIKNKVENQFYNNSIFKWYDFKILEDIK